MSEWAKRKKVELPEGPQGEEAGAADAEGPNLPAGGRVEDAAVEGEEAAARRLRSAGRTPVSLDALIHQRTRLAILSALAVEPSLSFNELKALLETSDGNVSVHTQKLEEAGLLEVRKSFRGRTPHTEYRLTNEGSSALERYLEHMERLIEAARGGEG